MSEYSKIKFWEVWNFMSIAHGKCEFDERGIINIKGYNDSGKSAMLRALDVLFYNIRPNFQVNFIKDDCDYFRVLVHFEDGVTIIRDKYINGQSLYEMYKDSELLYTTKVNGVLSKVSEVPEPIRIYLGLLSFDGINLNSRSCFEKQFLVQTTGSENYKALSYVLKSEELATAGVLLNNDKNKLSSDISALDGQLSAFKSLYEKDKGITESMVYYLENLDKKIDQESYYSERLSTIKNLSQDIDKIHIYDELKYIDSDSLQTLSTIKGVLSDIDHCSIYDEVSYIDDSKLQLLSEIKEVLNLIDKCSVQPEIDVLNSDSLSLLLSIKDLKGSIKPDMPEVKELQGGTLKSLLDIKTLISELSIVESELHDIDAKLNDLHSEMSSIMVEGSTNFVQCPDCGKIIEVK